MKPTTPNNSTTTGTNKSIHHHHQVKESMVIDAPIQTAWERLQAFKRGTLPLKEIQQRRDSNNSNAFAGNILDTYLNGVLWQVCITSSSQEGGEIKLKPKGDSSNQTLLEWTTSVSSTGGSDQEGAIADREHHFFAAFQEYLTNHVDLVDEIWLHIASFASPPDVYSLCLTSKRFHYPASSKSVNGTSTNDNEDESAATPPILIGTKLLRASLLSSLDKVLRAKGLSLEKVNTMFRHDTVSPGSVLISGSTMVQCVLGEVWKTKTDIDIFCSNSAAPAVRSWLIKEAGQLCTGFNDNYVGVDNFGRVFYNQIHHVECYCNRPEDGAPYIGWDALFNYQQSLQYGAQINRSYFPRRWQQLLYNFEDGDVRDRFSHLYEIASLPGDPFAFDYYCSWQPTTFDLVVSRANGRSVDDILADFDLNICKAKWNGTTFSIPDPHYTFRRRSKMDPQWNTWMKSYQRHYKMESGNDVDEDAEENCMERVWRIRIAMKEVRREHGNHVLAPHYRYGTRNRDLRREIEALTFHNFFYKLFSRVQKYEDRGIQVEDAPDTSNFGIQGLDLGNFREELFNHFDQT